PKIIEMFKKIKSSVFIDADTSLWYIAYLYDQGYSINDIISIQTEINSVVHDQIEGKYSDEHPSFNRIQNILSSVYDHAAS
ncbi:MAG: hypothetical protein ACKVJC_11860, partial [Flavobacteriales bacterium]